MNIDFLLSARQDLRLDALYSPVWIQSKHCSGMSEIFFDIFLNIWPFEGNLFLELSETEITFYFKKYFCKDIAKKTILV